MNNSSNLQTESVDTDLFYYKNGSGLKLYTPNEEFASVRASYYGTFPYYRV
jgi:hypothetical protein